MIRRRRWPSTPPTSARGSANSPRRSTRTTPTSRQRVDELTTALKVRDARTQLAKVTPIKGDSYANQLHLLLADVAAGLGDEYSDTSLSVGAITCRKKGDGVLTLGDGTARVVIEMTDSAREGWAEGALGEAVITLTETPH